MSDHDASGPSLYAYDPETGEHRHIADGEYVEPDLSRWERAIRRVKTTLYSKPAIMIVLAAGVLIVLEVAA